MEGVFVHEKAICETTNVGPRTRIWAFAHVLSGARIGADCNICDGVFIENDVIIGDRATVKCGVQLWDGIRVEDDVFIGPNATFTNEKFPRSKQHAAHFPRTVIRRGASIGANATVLPGLEIGLNAMVGAGAVVTRSVPANAVVYGNPARISGYVEDGDESSDPAIRSSSAAPQGVPVGVGGAALHQLCTVCDALREVSGGAFEQEIPFAPKRFFLILAAPDRENALAYAHRRSHRFVVCIRGSCTVQLDDSWSRREIVLDRPDAGLYLPPMIWGAQYAGSPDTIFMVFASHLDDDHDRIHNYDEFVAIARSQDA